MSFRQTPRSPLFPYTTLFRSELEPIIMRSKVTVTTDVQRDLKPISSDRQKVKQILAVARDRLQIALHVGRHRSEEHTSELQSHSDRVCRLLLEKKNTFKLS